jgi:leader peptidase (prepilin peptidase)/N-methyltransferase
VVASVLHQVCGRRWTRQASTRAALEHRLVRVLVAATAALAVGLVVWRIGPHAPVPAAAIGWLAVVAPTLAAVDLAERRLPDALTLGSLVVVAGLLIVGGTVSGDTSAIIDGGWGLLIVGGFLAIVALLAPARSGGLGAGDVKLAGLIGLTCGSLGLANAIVAVLAGLVLGALHGAAVIAYSRNATSVVPLGPALVFGALAAAIARAH